MSSITPSQEILSTYYGNLYKNEKHDSPDLNRVNMCRDISNIMPKKLLARGSNSVDHVQASGDDLPFKDESFDLAVSNHAIDFLPDFAFFEVARVLKPNRPFIFYFHHPSMLDSVDRVKNDQVREFWSELIESKKLFDSPERIEKTLATAGLVVDDIKICGNDVDQWWQIYGKSEDFN
jgi:ubiquinone/menaquinone biosynthesis C-methylase UbiE